MPVERRQCQVLPRRGQPHRRPAVRCSADGHGGRIADAADNGPRRRVRHGQNHYEIALTRKNFLFLGSEVGGDRAAILYSVLETIRRPTRLT
jgi:hypothetical protein